MATNSTETVKDLKIRRLEGSSADSKELQATWSWKKDNTDNFEVTWTYTTANGVKWDGSTASPKLPSSSYTAPANALKVTVKVKPVAKDKKWKAKETSATYTFGGDYTKPATPSVSQDPEKGTFTVSVTYKNTNASATKVEALCMQFQMLRNGTTKVNRYVEITSASGYVSYTFTSKVVTNGSTFQFRCRPVRRIKTGGTAGVMNMDGTVATPEKVDYKYEALGPWCDEWTEVYNSVPDAPEGFTKLEAYSKNEVLLKWKSVKGAKKYEIRYTNEELGFDIRPDVVQSVEANSTSLIVSTGDEGNEFYFQLRVVTSINGNEYTSKWSKTQSCKVGHVPNAPTTWSLQSSVALGDKVDLYFVHNSADNSSMRAAELRFKDPSNNVQGVDYTVRVTNPYLDDEEKRDLTQVYSLNTASCSSDTEIKWSVRTRGVLNEMGPWSVERSIKVYRQPSMDFMVAIPEVVNSYPLNFGVHVIPNTQRVLRYFVSITADEAYVAYHNDGTPYYVSAGTEAYSSYAEPNESNPNEYMWHLLPSDIDLENNISYHLKVTAAMDNGLTAEAETEFIPSWENINTYPNARLLYDSTSYSMTIRPFCEKSIEETIQDSNGRDILDTNGNTITETKYVNSSNVYLSVYRKEVDGTFTEIAKDLDGAYEVSVQDPHPSLYEAEYRIVSVDKTTGTMCFADIMEPIHDPSIVLQWDVDWEELEADVDDIEALASPLTHGEVLKLPFNIDSTFNADHDVSLVEYIGRSNPVSYYGTQRGETASHTLDIQKYDYDTINALRRLSIYPGDVYVREPSGIGYWANVKVSFSRNHNSVITPVTLDVTKVEGGV